MEQNFDSVMDIRLFPVCSLKVRCQFDVFLKIEMRQNLHSGEQRSVRAKCSGLTCCSRLLCLETESESDRSFMGASFSAIALVASRSAGERFPWKTNEAP